MKKALVFAALGAFVLLVLPSPSAMAQNAAVNPEFQTYNLQNWEGDDPSLMVITGKASLGMDSYCCKKRPGTPNDNGAISQMVHLFQGCTYEFSANIAAEFCSS